MTDRLPLCSSDEVVRALRRAGFVQAHSKGSHATFKRFADDGSVSAVTVVPLGKRQLQRPLLKNILALAKLSVEEFYACLIVAP